MDNLVNPSVENISLESLKMRIRSSFGDTIAEEVNEMVNLEDITAEECIGKIMDKITYTDKFLDIGEEFSHQFEDMLLDEEMGFGDLFSPSDNRNSSSLIGSTSSLNSCTIDFLSGDKVAEIVILLCSDSDFQKLEALGTINRISSLEHITKQSLWKDIEAGLIRIASSDVAILQDGLLTILGKLMSYPEPQVVQQGFLCLVKLVSESLPYNDDAVSDIFQKEQLPFLFRVLKAINTFQRYIPNHWLRYPNKVMSDIVVNSVTLLNIKLTWSVLAVFDTGAKWVESFTFGNISRTLLLKSFEENSTILKYIFEKCRFNLGPFTNCCSNVNVLEQISGICTISNLLQYNMGKKLVDKLYSEGNEYGWKSVLCRILNLSFDLCHYICNSCFSHLHAMVTKVFAALWPDDDTEFLFTTLCETFCKYGITNNFSICLFSESLHQFLQYPERARVVSAIMIGEENCLIHLINQFVQLLCSDSLLDCLLQPLYRSVLDAIKSILSVNIDILYTNQYLDSLAELLKTIIDVHSRIKTVSNTDDILVTQNLTNSICLEFVRKPIGIYACSKIKILDSFMPMVFNNIYQNFIPDSPFCSCSATLLLNILTYQDELEFENFGKLVTLLKDLYSGEMMQNNLKGKTAFINILLPFAVKLLWGKIEYLWSNYIFELFFKLNLTSDDNCLQDEEHLSCVLNVLSVIVYNIDALCALRYKTNIQELLLQLLSEYVREDDTILVTATSVLLNFIIVKLYYVSGPNEVMLPIKKLKNNEDTYDMPFILTYPPHLVYYNGNVNKETIDIDEDIRDMEMNEIKDVITNYLNKSVVIHFYCIAGILNKLLELMECNQVLEILEEKDSFVPNEHISNGIKLTIDMSTFIGCSSENVESNLAVLVKRCAHICDTDKKFDTFVGTVFLMSDCNLEKSWQFLESYSKFPNACFVWKRRCYQALNWTIVLEACDRIVAESLPTVYAAFKRCGILPSLMFDCWITQYYWNYLDWSEISCFIVLVTVYGGHYALYHFVSVLSHLRTYILQHSCNQDIITRLKGRPIVGYEISSYMTLIEGLAASHNDLIENALKVMFQNV